MKYTPTTETVKAYIRGNAVMVGATASEAQQAAEGWYAEEIRKAKEEAYDEGHEDGWDTGIDVYRFGEMSKGKVNPYRKETND